MKTPVALARALRRWSEEDRRVKRAALQRNQKVAWMAA